MKQKRDQQSLEKLYKDGERDQMLMAVNRKQMQDRNEQENYKLQKKLLGAEAQNLLNQKTRMAAEMKKNEFEADKA